MSKLTAADLQPRLGQVAHPLTVEKWDTLLEQAEIKLKAPKS